MGRFSFNHLFSKLPPTPVLVIHGVLDTVVPFTCGEEILRMLPTARLVPIGTRPGAVPSYQFGHAWFEYFDIEVWKSVFETFMASGLEAKL